MYFCPTVMGLSFAPKMKMKERYSNTAVIFLSSKEEVKSKVLGFSLGADDYIVKPCDPLELRARVDSRIKRTKILNRSELPLLKGICILSWISRWFRLKTDKAHQAQWI